MDCDRCNTMAGCKLPLHDECPLHNCEFECLTYTTDEGEYDVAAYSMHCPIHGWRWNYEGPVITLAGYQAKDQGEAMKLVAK
jgi:hypothetical protein